MAGGLRVARFTGRVEIEDRFVVRGFYPFSPRVQKINNNYNLVLILEDNEGATGIRSITPPEAKKLVQREKMQGIGLLVKDQ